MEWERIALEGILGVLGFFVALLGLAALGDLVLDRLRKRGGK